MTESLCRVQLPGSNKFKLERVVIQPHRHGRGEERRLYIDHFPVVATQRLP
jgi:predicted GNAT superfamily acetyltransferase